MRECTDSDQSWRQSDITTDDLHDYFPEFNVVEIRRTPREICGAEEFDVSPDGQQKSRDTSRDHFLTTLWYSPARKWRRRLAAIYI